MNDKIITFLNSDLLEKYLLGETTSVQTEMVETYISKYPEVQNAYRELEYNLEVVAKSHAVEAPKGILNNILDELDENPTIQLNQSKRSKPWYRFAIAASVAALVFAVSSYIFYSIDLCVLASVFLSIDRSI